jgi:hypothetical protein
MQHSVPILLASVALLGAPIPAAGQGPPVGTGTIEGFVYDSTAGEPLEGAMVALWETTFSAHSDDVGRFSFTGVPAGEYSVVFFHPRLGSLGISSGTRSVEVRSGETTTVPLATPSMNTVLVNECLLETGDPRAATAMGLVADGEAGVGMPGAYVTLRWFDEASRPREVEVVADGEGWYHACGLEPNLRVSVAASFLNMNSPRREFTTDTGSLNRLDFLLGSFGNADVTGTLRDLESGDPISGAEIRLLGTDFFTTSDTRGNFSVDEVPSGEYTVEVSHIGYRTRVEQVDLGSDLGVHLGIDMSVEAIELDPIVVTVDQNVVEERLAMGGMLITNEELEPLKARSNTLADLLRHRRIPGLLVRRTDNHLCAEFASGQVRLMRFSDCASVMLYIDGARAANPMGVLELQDDVIDRLVVFRPVEAGSLFGLGAAHGVIMIYTKHGRGRN